MDAMKERELSIEFLTPSSLKPYRNNARTHSKHQIRQIAESIRAFGFTNPILVDRTNSIVAGHGRVEAAKLLGMEQVPAIRLENLSQEQIRAYVIADNKLAENAGWDTSILAIELQHLLNIETEFDISVTDLRFQKSICCSLPEAPSRMRMTLSAVEENSSAVTQPGDMWKLGKHRILCGSAIEEASYSTLMA